MKKCLLMFAILALTLTVAVLMENENEIVPRDSLLLGGNHVENTLLE